MTGRTEGCLSGSVPRPMLDPAGCPASPRKVRTRGLVTAMVAPAMSLASFEEKNTTTGAVCCYRPITSTRFAPVWSSEGHLAWRAGASRPTYRPLAWSSIHSRCDHITTSQETRLRRPDRAGHVSTGLGARSRTGLTSSSESAQRPRTDSAATAAFCPSGNGGRQVGQERAWAGRLTVISRPPSTMSPAWVRPTRASLVAEMAARPAVQTNLIIEPIWMIRPRPSACIAGAGNRVYSSPAPSFSPTGWS